MPKGRRTVVGRTFKKKRWARRWAKGRKVAKVKGGYTIRKGRKRR